MLVDVTKEEQEVLESIRSSEKYKSANFDKSYNHLLGQKISLIEAAKIFILDNYKKVQDYSELTMLLRCANHKGSIPFGKKRERVNKAEMEGENVVAKMFREIEASKVEIKSFTEAVYDWTDGDFSVVLNDVNYNWIDDSAVISIASFIEENLPKETES